MGTEAFWMPIAASVAGSLISGAIAKKPDSGAAPTPAAAPAAPQVSKSPTSGAFSAANAAATRSGPGSTSLTGATGIDPTMLNLGRNTLLGA